MAGGDLRTLRINEQRNNRCMLLVADAIRNALTYSQPEMRKGCKGEVREGGAVFAME